MRASPHKELAAKVCQMCGNLIPAPPFAQVGGNFCCVACYLQSQSARVENVVSIQAEAALLAHASEDLINGEYSKEMPQTSKTAGLQSDRKSNKTY